MRKQSMQSGFTLIELVMVIVILGILAATALPKFVDLSSDAKTAATQGIAGALSSAASVNYAGCAASNQTAVAGKCVQVAKCSDVAALVNPTISVGTGSGKYVVSPDTAVTTNGNSVSCSIHKSGESQNSTYTAIGAAN